MAGVARHSVTVTARIKLPSVGRALYVAHNNFTDELFFEIPGLHLGPSHSCASFLGSIAGVVSRGKRTSSDSHM